MAHIRLLVRPLAAVTALSAGLALLTGCGDGSGTSGASGPAASGPVVVATSTWEAALAKAAGAKNVTSIVPASIRHAPDYDLKPSDLTAVAGADYVVYASFEPWAGRIKEAAGSKAKLVEVNLDNTPAAAKAEVTKLGAKFGTERAAAKWNARFTTEWNALARQVKATWPGGKAPAVAAQMFTTWAAKLAGAKTVGMYGPEAVTPAQLSALSAKKPQYVLENANMSAGTVLPGSGAKQLDIVNYPGKDLDLLAVYRNAAGQMEKAFSGS
ncbi:metal ABC transporter solute-binding protein, Zn/Mn family [Streptomyces chattanoogensis]|uniref:ABC transporter substrate-binding protein n=1 Tax=Streptomyces chattanoogensis TaxID=66876 RepID=A0A0N0XWA9_9ACTN|nr:zinc ABC transporter substrate-binding protein [Streptomyces chattanoogensis]KPC63918.1 ABC transporter substrate-binding protein [Streptomyces chattanoogensis]